MKRYTLFSALLISVFVSTAQELGFVNSNQRIINLNPSFAGSNGLFRNQFSYRNENANIYSSNVYYSNTLDFFLKSINGGVAINADWTDVANGSFDYRGVGLTYAQYVTFADKALKVIPSFQAVYRYSEYDHTAFHYPLLPNTWQNIPEKQNCWDFNTGLLFSVADKMFLGASIFHLTEPYLLKGFETKRSRKYTLHGSYYFDIGEKSLLQTSARFTNQSATNEFNLGLQAIFKTHFIVGTAYTIGPEVAMGTVGYRTRCFSVVYNYDVKFSKLAGSFAGSHELHLSYNLRTKETRDELATFEQF